MKSYGLVGVVTLLLLAISVNAVLAQYAPGPPEPGTLPGGTPSVGGVGGAPALVGTQMVGAFMVTYPDGKRVVLSEVTVTLKVCGNGGCVNVQATLTETSPGVYSYSFTPPSGVTGNVQVVLPGNSLTDANGTPFPSADTVVGTYTVTSSGAPPSGTSTPFSNTAPKKTQLPAVVRTTQPVQQASNPQTNLLILSALAVLSLAGFALVLAPRKSTTR